MSENYDEITDGPISLERVKHHCGQLCLKGSDWRAMEVEMHIDAQSQRIDELEEELEDKKQFLDFSNNVAAYDHLIANEIDHERIKLLESLRSSFMDDNK